MNSDIKFGKDIVIDEKTKIGIYSDIGDRIFNNILYTYKKSKCN